MAEADAVLAALTDVAVPEERCLHLSSEATVIAARTCKRENITGQHQLLSDALAAFNQVVADPQKKRVYSISSDDDSCWRRALARLTMSQELPTTSSIFGRSSMLPLNLQCGTWHNFKCYRNSLLRKKGVTVRGAIIIAAIIAAILKHHPSSLPKLTERRIDALSYSNDKQDVPLAFSLLTAIGRLPNATPDAAPTYAVARRILQLLGRLYSHLLEPYTSVELSLQHQLEHLSAAAHITLALYEEKNGMNLYKIKLNNARKSTKNSPCANTPPHCPYCNAAPVWKYSPSCHIDILHPTANDARFEEWWRIDKEESAQTSTKFKSTARKQRTTDHYTTESVPDSESAQTSLARSSSTILLSKRRLRGLSDASDSQDVSSVLKACLTVKIRPSAARLSSLQVKILLVSRAGRNEDTRQINGVAFPSTYIRYGTTAMCLTDARNTHWRCLIGVTLREVEPELNYPRVDGVIHAPCLNGGVPFGDLQKHLLPLGQEGPKLNTEHLEELCRDVESFWNGKRKLGYQGYAGIVAIQLDGDYMAEEIDWAWDLVKHGDDPLGTSSYSLFPEWRRGIERCVLLHHLSIDYGGQLLMPSQDYTICTAERNWIDTFALQNVRTIFLNHAYDEEKLGDNPAEGGPFWAGATTYWEKIAGKWALVHEDLTGLCRDRMEDVFYDEDESL
ncbi:hypothetical protein EV424DRAFT_1539905 [Suillus variegatus]|nr:hypothetical protein EV424DRAFT_1539905 [Suillus variegatus]